MRILCFHYVYKTCDDTELENAPVRFKAAVNQKGLQLSNHHAEARWGAEQRVTVSCDPQPKKKREFVTAAGECVSLKCVSSDGLLHVTRQQVCPV